MVPVVRVELAVIGVAFRAKPVAVSWPCGASKAMLSPPGAWGTMVAAACCPNAAPVEATPSKATMRTLGSDMFLLRLPKVCCT